MQIIDDETALANAFIQDFTKEELTCSGIGDYWQSAVIHNVCGDPNQSDKPSVAQHTANLIITLMILLIIETILIIDAFILSVQNYKQVGQIYRIGAIDDAETVDETYNLENEQDE